MYYEDGDRGSSRKYYERGTYGGRATKSESGIVIGTTPTRPQARARAKTTKSTGASAHWDDVLPMRDDRNFRTGWAKGAASVRLRAFRGAVPDCASGDMGGPETFLRRFNCERVS